MDDLHYLIDQWEIALEVQRRFSQKYSEGHIEMPEELRADFEQFLMDLDVKPDNLTEAQEGHLEFQFIYLRGLRGNAASLTEDEVRYLKRTYSNAVFTPDKSMALNNQIRDLVLYQEAIKQGYKVSQVEAREMYKELNTQGPDLSEEYLEYLKIEDEVIKEHGYRSREAYQNQQFPGYARSLSVSRLRYGFLEQWMAQYPDLQGYEYQIKADNAWHDYTENLIKHADIEIILELDS
ncbi:MAG: hypothetical protein AB1815_05420 [Bacillota bacterium]